MSALANGARVLLVLHGVTNVAQGLFSILLPQAYLEKTGDMFIGAPDKAIQSIGLGSLGVGWYSLVLAWSGNKLFFAATVPLRVAFAGLIASQWGWSGVVGYEASVAVVAAVAAYA